MSNITIFEEEFDNVTGFKMPDTGGNTVTYTEGGGGSPTLETVTKTYTPTASQQTETITPSSGFDGIGEVDVTVDAMPTGSYGAATWSKAIQQNKLFISSSFANFDDGYFASAPSVAASLDLEIKAVTPSETAQTVAPTDLNHYLYSVNVGAIPSEYVVPTGTKSITANGTGIDVTNYAAVDVNVSGGTPTITGLSATYVQSGTVDIHDELSKLVPDLTVTATISNTLQIDISPDEYTLSGTLSVGTSTITVSYSNLTATFTVTVTDYWDYYWDYSSGTLPPDTTFVTNGDASYSITANGLAMTSTTSSYVYLRLDNYQTTTHGMLEVVGNVSNINSYNNWRVCVSDGTNGAQTCMGDHYFRILNSTTGSSTERLCYANTNQDYTVRVTYYLNGSNITGSYRIDGCLLRSGYASSNVKYTTATRIWCQTMGGTLLIKQIKYRDMQ